MHLGVAGSVPLPSARREANLHQRLADVPDLGSVSATSAAELRTAMGASPADQVWQLLGYSGRHRLIDLPYTDTDHDDEFPTHAAPGQDGRVS